MVGLSQLLLRSHSANGLIEDYAACLELRSEECQIIEDSSVDPGVLIMQSKMLHAIAYGVRGGSPAPFSENGVGFCYGGGKVLLLQALKGEKAWGQGECSCAAMEGADGRGHDGGSEDGAAQGSERRCRTRVLGGKSPSLSAGAEPGFLREGRASLSLFLFSVSQRRKGNKKS
ncbi:UNVERIFIED_CONTAM: Nuclear pore complex protein [Sesamum angustifolium]|uniref:Nuclear pore complex protein n=1 Tax=Sesamum angustifolium TaxID=2727405 RepID=A0AAW2N5T0_9LAMI